MDFLKYDSFCGILEKKGDENVITKDITKNLKELKINGKDVSFSESSVRLIENTSKERINAIETIDVINWAWKVLVTSHVDNGFEMGVPVDVIAVAQKDSETFEGKIILESVETEECSDMYTEELLFIGVSKLDGYDDEVKPSEHNVMMSRM